MVAKVATAREGVGVGGWEKGRPWVCSGQTLLRRETERGGCCSGRCLWFVLCNDFPEIRLTCLAAHPPTVWESVFFVCSRSHTAAATANSRPSSSSLRKEHWCLPALAPHMPGPPPRPGGLRPPFPGPRPPVPAPDVLGIKPHAALGDGRLLLNVTFRRSSGVQRVSAPRPSSLWSVIPSLEGPRLSVRPSADGCGGGATFRLPGTVPPQVFASECAWGRVGASQGRACALAALFHVLEKLRPFPQQPPHLTFLPAAPRSTIPAPSPTPVTLATATLLVLKWDLAEVSNAFSW